MKLLLATYLFAFVALSLASTSAMECEEGTYVYVPDLSGCGHLVPEPTCDEPNPMKEEAIICDYSACYCNPPTVRDTITNKCVPLEKCPMK